MQSFANKLSGSQSRPHQGGDCYKWVQKILIGLGSPTTDKTYGHVDMQCTLKDYARLADATGFSVTSQENITRNTLPTYPVVLQLAHQSSHPVATQSTAMLQKLSQLGIIQYQVLGFRKPD